MTSKISLVIIKRFKTKKLGLLIKVKMGSLLSGLLYVRKRLLLFRWNCLKHVSKRFSVVKGDVTVCGRLLWYPFFRFTLPNLTGQPVFVVPDCSSHWGLRCCVPSFCTGPVRPTGDRGLVSPCSLREGTSVHSVPSPSRNSLGDGKDIPLTHFSRVYRGDVCLENLKELSINVILGRREM